MTDDAVIPIGEIRPTCPQCGAQLLIEHDGVEPKPEDRVFCPEHGTIGTREAVITQIREQHGKQIGKAVGDRVGGLLRGALKGSGFKID